MLLKARVKVIAIPKFSQIFLLIPDKSKIFHFGFEFLAELFTVWHFYYLH